MLSPKFRVVTLLLSDGVSEVIPVEKSLQKQNQSVFADAIDFSGYNSRQLYSTKPTAHAYNYHLSEVPGQTSRS